MSAVSRALSPTRDPRLTLCFALQRPDELAVSDGYAEACTRPPVPKPNYGIGSPIRIDNAIVRTMIESVPTKPGGVSTAVVIGCTSLRTLTARRRRPDATLSPEWSRLAAHAVPQLGYDAPDDMGVPTTNPVLRRLRSTPPARPRLAPDCD